MLRHVQDLLSGWGEAVDEALAELQPPRSHRWLARQCDVHPTTIDRIVRGELNPNDELKFKIAGALGKRMDILWGWPKIIPPHPTAVAS